MTAELALRRLALRMALLNESDRQWILEQLEVAERSRVLSLMEEVVRRGFVNTPELVGVALSETSQSLFPSAVSLNGPEIQQSCHPAWRALLVSARSGPEFSDRLFEPDVAAWADRFEGERLPPAWGGLLEARLASKGRPS
ncbi:hypothetical protein EV700_2435 [Fluviicoccus keumensis]|uniref:Uncharacterized protein n=1 Tax=Fluviicoccus keumensis TaxID=1435465 RepID=A0A4Q7YNT4_9GAMM|nr:hypothetical protein [Fluviicoccus keumensis]RZU38501.1 hypothetical protein EV700_2435 [Fluviicoccus keumensis]